MAKSCWILGNLFFLLVSISTSTSASVIKGNGTYYGIGEMRAKRLVFVNVKTDQNTALMNCITEYGGSLLSILSAQEDQIITDLIVSKGITDDIITSGKYNQYKNQWEWSTTADAFGYDNWESSLSFPNYCCFKMIQPINSFRWRGKQCNSNLGVYFCEVT